jgi:hypothetical protein
MLVRRVRASAGERFPAPARIAFHRKLCYL